MKHGTSSKGNRLKGVLLPGKIRVGLWELGTVIVEMTLFQCLELDIHIRGLHGIELNHYARTAREKVDLDNRFVPQAVAAHLLIDRQNE